MPGPAYRLARNLADLPAPSALRSVAARAILRRVLAAHPALGARLAPRGSRRLLVRPTDLSYGFLVTLRAGRVEIACVGRAAPPADAVVSGPILLLLALAEGRVDGDALFFNRALRISGDIELVVAVRNALDDAGLDLLGDLIGVVPPPLAALLRRTEAWARRAGEDALHLADAAGAVAARAPRPEAG